MTKVQKISRDAIVRAGEMCERNLRWAAEEVGAEPGSFGEMYADQCRNSAECWSASAFDWAVTA